MRDERKGRKSKKVKGHERGIKMREKKWRERECGAETKTERGKQTQKCKQV